LNQTRSRGIFEQALKGETFGPHPGYVDLKIRISIYNSISQQEERLPDKGIEMLVSSIDEVDTMLEIITKALRDWVSGMSPYQ